MKKALPLALALAVIPVGVDAQVGPPISVVGQAVELFPIDIERNRFDGVARLTLTIRNNTSQAISAWRAQVYFTDPFGEDMFQIQLTSGKANISPNDISEARFDFEDNEYRDGEPHDYLAQFDENAIGIRLEDIRVVN